MKYKKIAFLFPGQGAQYLGMGKDFSEQFPIAKHLFEEANDILKKNLTKLMWDGDEETLTKTKNSQVAIFVMSMALLRAFEQQLPPCKPQIVGGLSLGEYTAIAASNKLQFQDCLQLVDARAHLMNEACEKTAGTMAVVMGLDGDKVQALVNEMHMPQDIWTANFNCPGQVVISGTKKGIELASLKAKESGAKRVLPLQVHGAFHSGLMQSAEDGLKEKILLAPFKDSPVELAMNVTGSLVKTLDAVRANLIKQLTHPVRWEQGIGAIQKEGVDLFIEIGPGKTLSGMNKRIGVMAPTFSIEKVADLEAFAKEVT